MPAPIKKRRGPGKPEALEPFKWKKGCPSPNPSGRPKKKPITDRYLEAVETELPDEVRRKLYLPPGSTMGDAVARSVVLQAMGGPRRVEAAREVREAIEGRAPQAVDLKHSGKIEIVVVEEDSFKDEERKVS